MLLTQISAEVLAAGRGGARRQRLGRDRSRRSRDRRRAAGTTRPGARSVADLTCRRRGVSDRSRREPIARAGGGAMRPRARERMRRITPGQNPCRATAIAFSVAARRSSRSSAPQYFALNQAKTVCQDAPLGVPSDGAECNARPVLCCVVGRCGLPWRPRIDLRAGAVSFLPPHRLGPKSFRLAFSATPRTRAQRREDFRNLAFRGQHEHSLDAKDRLTIPAKLRSQLADGVVLFAGLDPCVEVWPAAEFEAFTEQALGSSIRSAPNAREHEPPLQLRRRGREPRFGRPGAHRQAR